MPTLHSPLRLRAAHPLRILYAEDLRELRDFTRMVLTKDGHLVETVPDGAAALAWLNQAGPAVDLLITDHHMPVMNGLELVHRVRRTEFPGKIIVFSPELDSLVHEEYHRLHVDLILPKPIFPATLRHILDRMFTPPDRAPRPVRVRLHDLALA